MPGKMALNIGGSKQKKKTGSRKIGNNKRRVAAYWGGLGHKARNVRRHLARDAKRAQRGSRPNRTPAGTARSERRRLERLAALATALATKEVGE